MKLPIYLDYSATTPVDPRVAQKMIPYLTEHFGNPASRSHSFGWTTEAAVEEAREHVAALVNCDPKEIVWTSGATEAINLALKGAAHFYQRQGQAPRHGAGPSTRRRSTRCASSSARASRSRISTCKPDGLLDLEAFKAALRPDTSVGLGDVRQQRDRRRFRTSPAIGEICRARGHHLPRRRRAGDGQGADRPARR